MFHFTKQSPDVSRTAVLSVIFNVPSNGLMMANVACSVYLSVLCSAVLRTNFGDLSPEKHTSY